MNNLLAGLGLGAIAATVARVASPELKRLIHLLDAERQAAIDANLDALVAARLKLDSFIDKADPEAPWYHSMIQAADANVVLMRHLVLALRSEIDDR